MIGMRDTGRRSPRLALQIGLLVAGALGIGERAQAALDGGCNEFWAPDRVTLSVDLKMAALARTAIDKVRVVIWRDGICGHGQTASAERVLGGGDPILTRIVDFEDLSPDPYCVEVSAFKDDELKAFRSIVIEPRQDYTLQAILYFEALLQLSKTASPIDVDGDGIIGLGDRISYRIEVLHIDDGRFEAVPDRSFVRSIAPRRASRCFRTQSWRVTDPSASSAARIPSSSTGLSSPRTGFHPGTPRSSKSRP